MPILGQTTDSAALLARQATSAAIAATTAAAAVATAAATTAASTTDSPTLSTTAGFGAVSVSGLAGSIEPTSSANATSTGSSSGSGGGGGGNSPLLFFVALGFGVVFTNLWIIVGVKYCFRYNARARQLRQAAEDGEPIGLENMPRPHRRRREKKLMTIDEVNEKFPMMKYKSWVATRAKHGLSTLGGIDAPSRANSVRSVDGVIIQHKERDSTDESEEQRKRDKDTAIVAVATTSTVNAGDALMHTATVTPASPNSPVAEAASSAVPHITPVSPTQGDAAAASVPGNDETAHEADDHYHHSDDEDDDHIDAALPPECIGTSGDTCAICIDTLENDDDVRGLTCGHAFHAVCLDPWLTSRRACCPLCKADYYTPKPRPTPQELADAQATGIITVSIPGHGEVRRHRINLSSRPGTTWTIFRSSGLTRQPGADAMQQASPSGTPAPAQSEGFSTTRNFFSRRRAATGPEISEQPLAEEPAPSTRSRRSWFSNIRPSMPAFRDSTRRRGDSNLLQGRASGNATAAAAELTPSQLEAGVRNESR